MAGLPKLPGFTFSDPTVSKFHLPQTFDLCNGYKLPKHNFTAIGGRELDANSVKHIEPKDPVRYDPSLTYGRTRSVALPQYLPHYALYDQKCLTFKAFFKQTVVESPNEFYRVRFVNIIYFLENDTITVMEPKTPNSGIDQGRLIRRGKIPKTESGRFWHWKDLAIGKDIPFYGTVFHTVDCDTFTREFMASQGLIMGEPEQIPGDPYTLNRLMSIRPAVTKTPPADDKLRRFLEYDGKVMKFKAIWDDRDSEYGELRKYEVLYFLSDDTVAVKEIHGKNDGRDPFPLLLRKTKLPKMYTDRPLTFPSICLEISEAEVSEYYQPKDFQVGETIFVLGRKMLLYDCDKFTRDYFKKALCIDQKPPIDIGEQQKPSPERQVPPHDGLGTLEDSLQNTLTFMPKAPRKDVIRQILNANKYLRYEMVMDAVHPEDEIRRFLLLYTLSDGTCKIHEPAIRNSGIMGGKYLRSTLLIKPGSDPLNPDYYTPADFYIGAIITVFQQRFKIVGADLYVYRYMQANEGKFPCEVIENMRNYMFSKGYLNDDIDDQLKDNLEMENKAHIDTIGKELEYKHSEMEECLKQLKVGGEGFDAARETAIKDNILREYEASLQHKYKVPPHGILDVNKTCAYPVVVGDVKSIECLEEPEGGYASYTPKHVDTPEEVTQKYYAGVLKKHHEVCADGRKPVECVDPPDLIDECRLPTTQEAVPLMVAPVDIPPGACKVKNVRFAEGPERCVRDKYDLCDHRTGKTQCDCTSYKKDCN